MPVSSTELTNLIDKLVNEQTFSLQAVSAIKDLRDRAAQLEKDLESSRQAQTAQQEMLNKNGGAISAANAKIAEAEKREKDLLAREQKVTELEKKTAVAEAKHEAFMDAFKTVFRNVTIRENAHHSISRGHMHPNGYTQMTNDSDSVTREETRE